MISTGVSIGGSFAGGSFLTNGAIISITTSFGSSVNFPLNKLLFFRESSLASSGITYIPLSLILS